MAADVTPNQEVFDALCEGKKQEAIAKKLGISVGVLRSLRRGELVSRGTIEHVAEKMQRPILELILLNPDSLIPDDPNWFEKTRYGWFIDNDRRRYGSAFWYRERVELARLKSKKLSRGRFQFSGKITNQFGEEFEVTGDRLNEHHFSLTGVSTQHGWSFDASFTLRIGTVLCGTWSGINHLASNMALYRMFMSADELSIDDLQELTTRTRIECAFQAEIFG